MPPDPHDPRPTHKVTLRLTGVMHGLDVTIACEVDVRKLDASLRYLISQGLEPTPRPLVFDIAPNGRPICPRHRAVMEEREKQGDRWYSSPRPRPRRRGALVPGLRRTREPGYMVEAGVLSIPTRQPAGTIGHPAGATAVEPKRPAVAGTGHQCSREEHARQAAEAGLREGRLMLHVFTDDRRRIATRRRSHLPFDGGDGTPGTYSASVWDHESQGWERVAGPVALMSLRTVIRQLEAEGWSPVSYLIEKD